VQLSEAIRTIYKVERDRNYWKQRCKLTEKQLKDTEQLLRWYQRTHGQKECG